MSLPQQNFVDQVGPVVPAAWLNLVDLIRLAITADLAGDIAVAGALSSGGALTAGGNLTAPNLLTPGTVQANLVNSNSVITTSLIAASLIALLGNNLLLGANAATIMQLLASGAIQGKGLQSGTMLDMAPDASTFTGTCPDVSTGPGQGPIIWRKMGPFVSLFCGTLNGTSNDAALTLTGLPAYLQPQVQQILPCNVLDGGSNTAGCVTISPGSGTLVFGRALQSGTTVLYSNGSFTTSGMKGFNGTVVGPYILS